jgi:hypothetical protein
MVRGMDTTTEPTPDRTDRAGAEPQRDRFIDAVRAGALLVVVFGHWLATLPRVVDSTTVATDHLLHAWIPAAWLTWVLQVVPLFVLVSAAASSPVDRGETLAWWSERAQRLARPTVTYLAVLAALWGWSQVREPVGIFAGLFSGSLTVHLWFVVMLLLVQLALPLAHRWDRQYGLAVIVVLVAAAFAVDASRFVLAGGGNPARFGLIVATAPAGFGWLNVVAVWLVPQQLGLAWRNGRLTGRRAGAALVLGGAAFAGACVAVGYPVGMVGADPRTGASNVLPPTVALLGIVAIQAGLVLLLEHPVRRWLDHRGRWRIVQVLAALGMPLYLWHKLAELPALWIANRLGVTVDRGLPGDPGFWTGRLVWIGLCALVVVPLVAVVVVFERRRRPRVPQHPAAWRQAGGAVLILAAAVLALDGGLPATPIAAAGMLSGSLLLRRRLLTRHR